MDYIQNIKNLITEKKLKHYEIAPSIGVTPTTFSNWMSYKNPMPMNAYVALCDYLKLPYAYFFNDRPEKGDQIIKEDLNEIARLLRENNRLKDRVIELQDKLYGNSYNALNERAG